MMFLITMLHHLYHHEIKMRPPTTDYCGITSHDEIHGDNGNLDEVLRNPSTLINIIEPHDVITNQCITSDSEVVFDESRVPEIVQENISYLSSTSVSHLAANPAYSTLLLRY